MNIVLMLASSTGVLSAQSERGTSSARASLVGPKFQAARDVAYRTINGKALKLDLYVPYDRAPGRHARSDPDTILSQQTIERFLRRHNILMAAPQ